MVNFCSDNASGAAPEAMIAGLFERGFEFYRRGPEANCEVRLVTAFNTDPAQVAAFLAAARELAEAGDDARRRA